jgi:hypothetical protein
MTTQTEIIMNEATDKIVDYMYREEDRHFNECLEEEDTKNKNIFMTKLKEHILYSIIVIKFKGNIQEIDDFCESYWEENKNIDEE